MWNYLYELWRSVLRRAPQHSATPPADDSPRKALREDLRRLRAERSTLQQTAASYREFGYDELAGRIDEELAAADRKIAAIRLRLRLSPVVRGRG
jgi:hypothetical protein